MLFIYWFLLPVHNSISRPLAWTRFLQVISRPSEITFILIIVCFPDQVIHMDFLPACRNISASWRTAHSRFSQLSRRSFHHSYVSSLESQQETMGTALPILCFTLRSYRLYTSPLSNWRISRFLYCFSRPLDIISTVSATSRIFYHPYFPSSSRSRHQESLFLYSDLH